MKIKNFIKHFIKAIWELPQNLIALFLDGIGLCKPHSTYKDVIVCTWDIPGGISLGSFVFIDGSVIDTPEGEEMIKHEYGHSIQSKYLGWLYLLVIGLPSFIWANCFNKYRRKTGKSYYGFYTEKWADKLGGVTRK